MYGGRVIDDFDRRIVRVYMDEYMGEFLFDTFQPFHFYHDDNVDYKIPAVADTREDFIGEFFLYCRVSQCLVCDTRKYDGEIGPLRLVWTNFLSLSHDDHQRCSTSATAKINKFDFTSLRIAIHCFFSPSFYFRTTIFLSSSKTSDNIFVMAESN